MSTIDTATLGSSWQTWGVVAVWVWVYVGMFLGGMPRLQLDRAGVALLGAVAMMGLSGLSAQEAAAMVDWTTLALLFAFMLISGQLRLAGFYTHLTMRIAGRPLSPPQLMAALIATAAGLSALFTNDVVCLAMTPVLVHVCVQRRLDPVPYLLALACAANIGSAATLIGNPQNMLIGSVLGLSFAGYSLQALAPVVVSLGLLWAWLVLPGRLDAAALQPPDDGTPTPPGGSEPRHDAGQTRKGLLVVASVLMLLLFSGWPHALVALLGAGAVLISRRVASARVLEHVDWSLLVLFVGLFVVNAAVSATGMPAALVQALNTAGFSLSSPGVLMTGGVVLSNVVSNVPAVMLILPHLAQAPASVGTLLALSTTFAGNLLLVGSIANLIVADMAARHGVCIDWRRHMTVGVPVTLGSMSVLWLWVWVMP